MWSPNEKVWSPKIKNVESKILHNNYVVLLPFMVNKDRPIQPATKCSPVIPVFLEI